MQRYVVEYGVHTGRAQLGEHGHSLCGARQQDVEEMTVGTALGRHGWQAEQPCIVAIGQSLVVAGEDLAAPVLNALEVLELTVEIGRHELRRYVRGAEV